MSTTTLTMFSRTLLPLRVATTSRILLAACRISPVSCRRFLTTSTTSQPPVPPSQQPSSHILESQGVASSAPIQRIPASTPAQAQAPSQPRSPKQLPYFVGRNTFNHFGVYQRSDRGGSLHRTLLKRAEGNLQALKQDVATALNLTAAEIRINNTTKHIEVKGKRRDEIIRFLQNLGF